MLRSFDLENDSNHENLKEKVANPFDYLLQSTAWLQSKPSLNTKIKEKKDIINNSNQKENKS
jgi:hypothetical protein